MTKRPTAEERKSADHGGCPADYEQTIRAHLAKVLKDCDNLNLKIYDPSKAWGRVSGSSELVFGWSVRVRVRYKNKGDRPQTGFRHFMFRGEQVVSTTRVGLGYRLKAATKPARPGK